MKTIIKQGLCYELDEKNHTAKVVHNGNYRTLKSANILSTITYENIIYKVISIGDNAFAFNIGCCKIANVTIPNSVKSIGEYAFYECSGLTSVTIPNSVTSIGELAFYECSGLTSVTIGNSVTSIGNEAFENCGGLTSVTIPNSVTSIGKNAFENCNELTSINVVEDNPTYSSADGVLYNKNKDTMICCPAGKTEFVDIPNTVETIGDYAFAYCRKLSTITIPNSVGSIGMKAFWECNGLTDITIGSSVKSIEDFDFANCCNLTNISINSQAFSYGPYEFSLSSPIKIQIKKRQY